MTWKLLMAGVLGAVIFASLATRAPRRRASWTELRGLVACALGLYAMGGLALLTHHRLLAVVLDGSGIAVSALAAWLSRGSDSGGPPGGGEDPVDEQPPPEPDGLPRVDWPAFERDFRDYAQRAPVAR